METSFQGAAHGTFVCRLREVLHLSPPRGFTFVASARFYVGRLRGGATRRIPIMRKRELIVLAAGLAGGEQE
jgi:hypothetical protein